MTDEKDDVVTTEVQEVDEQKEVTTEDTPEEKEEEVTIDLEKITPEVRRQREEEKKEEEEEEIDYDDQKRISKIVQREVGSKLVEMENKSEVQAFVASKPEFAKYQGVILKYMAHPDYANIPVHNIAAIVASKDLMKIGAAKEREAQDKVNKTKDSGTTVRKLESQSKDWHTASKEDFEAQRNKVLGRQEY